MSLLERVKNINLFRSREVICVEANQHDKEFRFRSIRIKNQFGKISIVSQNDTFSSFENSLKSITRKYKIPFTANKPICLLLSGEGVVMRSVDSSLNEESDAVLIQKVLPGAKINEFILQKDWLGEKLYVSVVKLSLIKSLIQTFSEAQLSIINIRIGPFDGLMFQEELESSGESNVGNYDVDWSEQSVKSASASSVRLVDLGDVKLPYALVPCFGSAISTSSWNYSTNSLPEKVIENNTEMKFWHYQIAMLRVFFLAIIFMISSAYFLNRNFQDALIVLQDTTAEQNNSFQLFEIKQSEYNSKIGILSSTGVNSSKNITQIGDRIGVTRPTSIKLLEMNIFPLSKKIKKDKRIEINRKVVSITGVTYDSNILNKWIEILNTESWTSEVTIVNFSQTDKQNPGLFELEILLNE
jgi:hypothetical protein